MDIIARVHLFHAGHEFSPTPGSLSSRHSCVDSDQGQDDLDSCRSLHWSFLHQTATVASLGTLKNLTERIPPVPDVEMPSVRTQYTRARPTHSRPLRETAVRGHQALRRYSPGVISSRCRKRLVMCDWLEKPHEAATSTMLGPFCLSWS